MKYMVRICKQHASKPDLHDCSLPTRKEPYWVTLERGLSAGYYRSAGGTGTWWGRKLVDGRYTVTHWRWPTTTSTPMASRILNWAQAQAAIRTWAPQPSGASALTVAQAVAGLRRRSARA